MNATSPLAAMIWKELREGLKWAALALLLTAGAVIFVLANHRGFGPGHTQYRGVGSPILADDFQAVTIIASAVTALLLSLAQTMPEKRLDKWAFLVHRPVSRTRLLLGKIIAALILYAIAVGVPFLGAILWVATPGHVPAPFEPAMALPGVADLLAGVMYYFAGMLIGLREARWYGSRVLPIGLAITASVAVFAVPAFWQALLVILGVTAVLAVAAWGSFASGGNYAPQPRVAKTALGVAVFAGVVLLGGAGVATLAGMLSAQRDEWVYTNYAVSPEGKIYRYTQRQSGTSATVTVTDPAGNPVAQYPQSVDAAAFHTTMQSTPSAGMWVGKQQSIAGVFRSYRRAERYSLTLSPGQEEAWYYVMSKGHVVGYDARDSRVIGYVTPSGFVPGPREPEQRFAESPLFSSIWTGWQRLIFPSGVYRVNIADRRLDALFTPPPGERVLAAGSATVPGVHSHGVSHENKRVFDAFATTSRLYLQAPDGKPVLTAALEVPPADYGMITVYHPEESGRYFVWYYPSYESAASWRSPHRVVELSPAGEVLARYDLPAVPFYPHVSSPAESLVIGAASPPAGVLMSLLLWPRVFDGEPLTDILQNRDTRLTLQATLIAGVLCALLTFAIGRRYALGKRALIGWTAGNFLLGPAGVLTMLSLRNWPVLEVCPSCRKRRVVNRELCPTCAAPFTPPAVDGTEIFAT